MAFWRKALKKIGVFICILQYLVLATAVHWLPLKSKTKQKLRLYNLKLHGRFMAIVVGLRVSILGQRANLKNRDAHLMVCNHLSYLDIVAISALRPFIWITSVEMGQDKFIGTLSRMAGAIFVERRNRDRVQEELQEMVDYARGGFSLGLFPEGTSTDGSSILKFKRTFFDVSKDASIPILPVSVRYRWIDGEPFSFSNADRVCWYGDMDFFSHLDQLLELKKVDVELCIGEFIHPKKDDDRRSLAIKAQSAVEALYGVSSSSLPQDPDGLSAIGVQSEIKDQVRV
jgi:1-acyl-sn-glycerol-3-phosphate acyltransferase